MFEQFVLNASVFQCLLITVLAGVLFVMLSRALLEGLFRVGRSAETLCDIRGRYSFWELQFLEHIIRDADHEAEFSRVIAVYHDLALALMWAAVLLTVPACFMDQFRQVMAWIAILLTLVFYVPMVALHMALTKDGVRRFLMD